MNIAEQELERLLQEGLNLLRTPETVIRLTDEQASQRAAVLRVDGLTYAAIAKVMGRYHGLWYSETKWRKLCRAGGAPPKHYANGPRVPPWMQKAVS